jgi:hypothetical protein
MTCPRFPGTAAASWQDHEPAAERNAVEPDLNAAVVLPGGGADLLNDLCLMCVFRDRSVMAGVGCVP